MKLSCCASIIRRATLGDLPSLAKIEDKAFQEHGYPRFFFRQALDSMGPYLFVAESGGSISGYALGVPGAREGWVLSIAVAPAFRRRGVGSALLRSLVKRLRERKPRRILLTVSPGNRGAVSLYFDIGFKVVRRESNYFGDRQDRLVMALKCG
jgi:ribosomal-protein-alanine N-acetyltransferase